MNLYEQLLEYSQSEYYPMHMPGHKRNLEVSNMENPYCLDITEIEGFDNLQGPDSILLEAMKRAETLYQSEFTHYLVGGSTAGILAGIGACTKKGDKIIVARNSHKSVYNAIIINELMPIYVYPQFNPQININCGLNTMDFENLLKIHPDISLIVITSPTYEGILSDVSEIAKVAHSYGIPLLVDEAHGAHLGFHPDFPYNAIQAGADIVIHSMHKTLPALSQSALLHVNGQLVSKSIVKKYINMYQTTSPSYVLMSSMEQCVSMLLIKKEELFDSYIKRLKEFREKLKPLKWLKLIDQYSIEPQGGYIFDPSKLLISVTGINITARDLYYILLDTYKIQLEMSSKDYVLGMTSIADTEEGFYRLAAALLEIDKSLTLDDTKREKTAFNDKNNFQGITKDIEMAVEPYIAYGNASESIPIEESVNRIAADFIYLYPPGIPLLVPGEKMSRGLLDYILMLMKEGYEIQGLIKTDIVYMSVMVEIF